ncbi:MAG: formimidoylglutamase [Ginsengibacter sp.]|jgi:formiminoglutamase
MLSHFKIFNKKKALSLTHTRKFETKLGEIIGCAQSDEKEIEKIISATKAQYIVVGIPEDIGVKANLGKGGAATAWPSFLESFLNIQSNDFLSGENMLIAGSFDFSEAQKLINVTAVNEEEKIIAYRSFVSKIDDEVEEIVKIITQNEKIPILIGGGHNNAYPAIKGAAKGLYKNGLIPLAQINCVNLDAHADFRPAEGRHSGNSFRYADEAGYLDKYYVVGLHENYLQQNVWMDMVNDPFIDCITYEDIFIHEKNNFLQAISHAFSFTEDNYTGIELDLDCIESVLSSAITPCGFSTIHARQYVNYAAMDTKAAYLHICEGAAKMDSGETTPTIGKLISYLVSDFVKAHSSVR